MEILIIVFLLIVLIIIWVISTQRKLVVLDENINNSMNQIGVQLSSLFDALTALLALVEDYAAVRPQAIMDTARFSRITITAKAKPEEVLKQESIINKAIEHIIAIEEQNPGLKADKNYTRYMDAVDSYRKMVYTSSLIYNDSVAKLNRTVRMAPTNLIAGLLGFPKRDYLKFKEREEVKKKM